MFTPGKTFCKVTTQGRVSGGTVEGGGGTGAASLSLAENPSQDPHADTDSPVFHVSCTWEDITPANARPSATAFKVEVTNGNSVWSKRVTLAELRGLRPEDITEDEYLTATQAALSGIKNLKTQRTQLLIAATEFDAEISWFFVLDQGLKFELGKLALTSVSVHEARGTWMRWIDELITKRTETLERSTELEETVVDLRAQKAALVKELEEWVTMRRETVERTIYKKFKDVLNAKKAKIRNLLQANAALASEALEAQRALELSVPASGPSHPPSQAALTEAAHEVNVAEGASDGSGQKRKREEAENDTAAVQPAKRPALPGNLASVNPAARAVQQADNHNDDDENDSSSDNGRPPALFNAMRLKAPIGRRKPTPTSAGNTTPVPRDSRGASPPVPTSRQSSALTRKASNVSNEETAESLLQNLE
ncbi:hypothetical protein HDU87_001105 [Geranomyces variabilis]|uniref:XRCC4 coiled-coil domain-containing protein n=1 Tax=Geranomyces variabilis TaxID=109894 RepID=A0AAD5TSX0_9FUNG|nr:hypothetical protein HDU87_001105 [Geranomyces variabilis]